MKTGKVKWFNNAKGYGFILSDEQEEDLFAHYSSIQMDGYKTLKAGQAVIFDLVRGDKGLHATNIRLAEEISNTDKPNIIDNKSDINSQPEDSQLESIAD